MSEIGTLSLERLNNGAHFLFISNVLARAEADANVKSKLCAQIVSLKAAMSKRTRTWKSRKKVCLQMTSLQPMHQGLCLRPKDATWQGNGTLVIIKYKYVKEFHFCVIFLAKKFVLSMIIRIFAASVLAKPLNNAQIVRGVFCLYTFEYGESYSLYKTVWIFRKSRWFAWISRFTNLW